MFYFHLIARRAAQSKAKPSSGRLQLEYLEDRLVPTVPPNGSILITNWHAFDNNPSPPPPGIIGLLANQSGVITGVQTKVATNDMLANGSTLFQKPSNLCQDPNSNVVYVTDDGDFTGLSIGSQGAVLKVQFSSTSNPLVTIVSKGNYLIDPTGVALINGYLYVTDTGTTSSQLGHGYVVKIDPATGIQTEFFGTFGVFRCPVGLAPAYNNNQLDATTLWVADQGSNQANEPGTIPVGTIWKVDLTNPDATPIAISQGGLLTIHTDYTYPPRNYALGNLQDVAVDPSSGNLYVSQYGFQIAAGSVVDVNPNGGGQTEIAQDDGQNSQPPTPNPNCVLGWYVGPVGWDANYNGLGAKVITAAAHKTDSTNQQGGHVCVVTPIAGTNDVNVTKISENGVNGDGSLIATPTGIITYKNTGSGHAALPSPGHSATVLGSTDVTAPDTMDLSSIASAPGGAVPAINNLGTGNIEQPSGVSNLADLNVPDAQAGGFRENDDGTSVLPSILTDRLQIKDNSGSMEEAYFSMELAHSQWDRLITTVPALGSI